ncbi:MAG: gamma-glutamylcyclotransferase family protein [Acetobacteraceae bacterium]
MRLFLYGTLLDPETLARRGGDPSLSRRLRPASLPGWRRVALGATRWPTLRRARSFHTPGAIVWVGAAALGRLAAYEGPAYRLRRVVVTTASGNTAAATWVAPGGTHRPWRT